ncbi:hypothetical protein [Microbacterium sp.]|nr:hypothetical protein [Microbacterium sp.]HEX5728476.1 hypothetical protein [Microbacterium sp.]
MRAPRASVPRPNEDGQPGKPDSTVWRIDSVLADELAARIEGIYLEDL